MTNNYQQILISSIINLKDNELYKYKLHLAYWNGEDHPLNVYLNNWDNWIRWNEYRKNKDDFNRQYIFSLIHFYHEPNKWLFGGIFEVTQRYSDWSDTEVGYNVKLVDLHIDLIGRLVIDFNRYQGMRGRAFLLENYFKHFVVSEILKKPFDGMTFPGYENIKIDFNELESIFYHEKNDWKGALENVKGVYVICDKLNGKKYVGSAYGDFGIWARWSVYINTGHGYNDELTKIISLNGTDYARKYFRFSLLEYRSMNTEDNIIIKRESFWKHVLLTIGAHGYNKN